jgi:hypothetical protein
MIYEKREKRRLRQFSEIAVVAEHSKNGVGAAERSKA